MARLAALERSHDQQATVARLACGLARTGQGSRLHDRARGRRLVGAL